MLQAFIDNGLNREQLLAEVSLQLYVYTPPTPRPLRLAS